PRARGTTARIGAWAWLTPARRAYTDELQPGDYWRSPRGVAAGPLRRIPLAQPRPFRSTGADGAEAPPGHGLSVTGRGILRALSRGHGVIPERNGCGGAVKPQLRRPPRRLPGGAEEPVFAAPTL